MCITKNQRNLLRTVELGDNELFGHPNRSVFRTFESRVLTVLDCPKIAGAKGLTVIDFPILRVLKHP